MYCTMYSLFYFDPGKANATASSSWLTKKVVLDFSHHASVIIQKGEKKRVMKSVSEITCCYLFIRTPTFIPGAPGECQGRAMVVVKSLTLQSSFSLVVVWERVTFCQRDSDEGSQNQKEVILSQNQKEKSVKSFYIVSHLSWTKSSLEKENFSPWDLWLRGMY